MNEQREQMKGRALTGKYLAIVRTRQRIVNDIKALIQLCVDFVPLFDAIREENANRLGWWLNEYAPAVDQREARTFKSLATRTQNSDHIESWQLRILRMVSSIHHRDKPLVDGRTRRRFKGKSWVYHVAKAHDGLDHQIRAMGGIKAMTDEERGRMSEQCRALRDLMDRMGGISQQLSNR